MKFSLQIACPPNTAALPKSKDIKSITTLFDSNYEICIKLISSEESRQLNKQFRNKNAPTNVLSFPFFSPSNNTPLFITKNERSYLGDLALCHDVITKESISQKKPLLNHYSHLIIHGILHLKGFDHKNDQEAQKMEALEISYLNQLGIPNPYEGQT